MRDTPPFSFSLGERKLMTTSWVICGSVPNLSSPNSLSSIFHPRSSVSILIGACKNLGSFPSI
jgi:hypothetical protein